MSDLWPRRCSPSPGRVRARPPFVCHAAQRHRGAAADEPIVAAPGDNAWRDYWILSAYRDSPATSPTGGHPSRRKMQSVALGRGAVDRAGLGRGLYARPGCGSSDRGFGRVRGRGGAPPRRPGRRRQLARVAGRVVAAARRELRVQPVGGTACWGTGRAGWRSRTSCRRCCSLSRIFIERFTSPTVTLNFSRRLVSLGP